jgi:hypothetical protein
MQQLRYLWRPAPTRCNIHAATNTNVSNPSQGTRGALQSSVQDSCHRSLVIVRAAAAAAAAIGHRARIKAQCNDTSTVAPQGLMVRVKTHLTQVHRYTGSQVHRFTGSQVHRHIGMQVHRHAGTQAYKYIGMQAYGAWS